MDSPDLDQHGPGAGIQGHEAVGLSAIGGSRVIQHWNVPDDKNQAKKALREGKVDVLTLSPMHQPDDGIEKFAELGLKGNPNIRVTIQEFWIPYDSMQWPYKGDKGAKPSMTHFDAATGETLRKLHEPYFKTFDDYVIALNAKLGKQVVFVVPVGQAVIALREKIIAGGAPGIEKQSDLFSDPLGHPKAAVQALAGYCEFAVIYRRNPVGMPMPRVLAAAKGSEDLNRLLQALAWDAVSHHPLSGVRAVKQAADIRRISLEGKDGVPAPVAEPGKDGIDRIHKVETPALELFPTTQKPARGTIMVCPGGGYGILAINHEGYFVAKKLNEFGYDVAILLYHVSAGKQTRELAIADAKAALALLQERGGEFGLSTKKIGVMGFSAGGHLAARLTHATAAGTPPDFVVLMYPAYLEKGGKVLDEVAPMKTPAFVYVGGDDKLAPSSVAYAAACKEAKVPCDFTKTEHGGHGFGLKPGLPPDVKNWPDKLHAFLDGLK